jgi:hypothetical protein
MVSALLSGIMLFAGCSLVYAQQGDAEPNMLVWSSHWIITVLGMAVAARFAVQAFNRPAVPVADLPTFPRYMTNRMQYRLGTLIFVIFACGIFLLLVHEHRDVVVTLNSLDVPIPKNILEAVKDQSAPYLLVITAMGAVYLYFLTKEAQWNVLLMMRDVIQRWISIPELTGQIIAQIRFSLRVPGDAIADVISSVKGVVEQDFRKDSNTPDRIWAETCYMKWWLTQGHEAGEDATFFTEESFGFDNLLDDFQRMSSDMEKWKSGAAVDVMTTDLPKRIKGLHNRISRLIACYLIYRNGSKKELSAEAHMFGIDLSDAVPENPLSYWIIYATVLAASVYIGVLASAISYDLFTGQGLRVDQDINRTLAWIMYTLCNYGLAIFVILSLRLTAQSLQIDLNRSHLVTYCWTFLVAFIVGPLGLTTAVHFFGEGTLPEMPIYLLYFNMLKWGWGPALVSVYISYYLDRQTYHDLPDIDHSSATFTWRLLNSFGFAAANLFLLLPQLLSLTAQPNATWDSAKLRFVATGCTFCVAFGLGLAAQFALRKRAQTLSSPLPSSESTVTEDHGGGSRSAAAALPFGVRLHDAAIGGAGPGDSALQQKGTN